MQVANRTSEKLVRKQFLIHPDQIDKLQALTKKGNTSAAEIVRRAIDAYNPDIPSGVDESELFELVAARLKEAIGATQKTRLKLEKTVKKLGHGGG